MISAAYETERGELRFKIKLEKIESLLKFALNCLAG